VVIPVPYMKTDIENLISAYSKMKNTGKITTAHPITESLLDQPMF
jgi:hypothetical protein